MIMVLFYVRPILKWKPRVLGYSVKNFKMVAAKYGTEGGVPRGTLWDGADASL